MGAAELAERLDARRSGKGWTARCPTHEDRVASLSIAEADDGRTLIHCHAGCSPEAVMAAVGLTISDLRPPTSPAPGPKGPAKRWVIRDAEGNPLAVHGRRDTQKGKQIWWERPDGQKGLGHLLTPDNMIYGLDLLAQQPSAEVIVAEGEKAADALRAGGYLALGTVCGAGHTPSLAVLEPLRGRRVVLWPDHDAIGRRHMDRIALLLCNLDCEVRVVAWAGAAPKADAADCPPELIAELIAAAKPWEPPPSLPAASKEVSGDEPWLEGGHLPRTDLGNAQRFVAEHGQDLRCVPEIGWYEWTGKVWTHREAAPHQRAAQTVRSIWREAADEPDKYLRPDLAAWAKTSESASRLAAIVAIAANDSAIVARGVDFDRDSWALNCLNGTIDLRTGTLRPHRREDLISMMAPVEFDPAAKFEPWDRFLGEATGGDEDLQRYLQRWVGYSLTAEVIEDKFAILHGPGGTGKTTFIAAITHMVGPYAAMLRTEALTKGNSSGGHNEDIARLVGKRLVVMAEASEGEQFRWGLVKQLTGGDPLSASYKNKPVFDFDAVLKLWLGTNHIPRIPEDDSGVQRRLDKLPFDVRPRRTDPALRYVLQTDPRARSAILAWGVQGCLDWQREGLVAPSAVVEATAKVWADQDTLADFFEACLVFGDEYRAASAAITEAYESYADVERIPSRYRVGHKAIAAHLNARGCTAAKGTGGRRMWRGVGVLDVGGDRDPAARESGASGAGGATSSHLALAREGGSTQNGATRATRATPGGREGMMRSSDGRAVPDFDPLPVEAYASGPDLDGEVVP